MRAYICYTADFILVQTSVGLCLGMVGLDIDHDTLAGPIHQQTYRRRIKIWIIWDIKGQIDVNSSKRKTVKKYNQL